MGSKEVLGEFEHHVLLAALRLGEEVWTASIVEEIEKRTGREVAAAAVYISLRRLEENGLVTSSLKRAGAGRKNERRYFLVTDAGLAMVLEARRRFFRLWEDLDVLAEEG